MSDLPNINKLSLNNKDNNTTNQQDDSDDEYDMLASDNNNNTNTILGFIDQPNNAQYLLRQYFPSKIGGRPAWLLPCNLPTIQKLTCKYCNNIMTFLLQLYAPLRQLQQTTFHRTLYLFTCNNTTCIEQGSIICLRTQLSLNNEYYSNISPPNLPTTSTLPRLWPIDTSYNNTYLCVLCGYNSILCDSICHEVYCSQQHQNIDWKLGHSQCCKNNDINELPRLIDISQCNKQDSFNNTTTTNAALTEEQKQQRKEQRKAYSTLQLARQSYLLPQYIIEHDNEQDCIEDDNNNNTQQSSHEQQLYEQYKKENSNNNDSDDDMNNTTTNNSAQTNNRRPTIAAAFNANVNTSNDNIVDNDDNDDIDELFDNHVVSRQSKDKQFNIFQSVVNKVSDQVIRYNRGSKPLYISTNNQYKDNKNCKYCNSKLIFEFQVLPQLIYYITKDARDRYNNIDWGTLLVYTCSNSCNVEGYAQEYVHVQPAVFNQTR